MTENIINHALQAWQYLALLFMYEIKEIFQWKLNVIIYKEVLNGYFASNAFSIGSNVNIRVHSYGPKFCSATSDPLNESSSHCLSPVKVSWCEVRFNNFLAKCVCIEKLLSVSHCCFLIFDKVPFQFAWYLQIVDIFQLFTYC